MKFSFDIESVKEDELKVNKMVFTGNTEFMLKALMFLVGIITEEGPLEVKDIIELLEGWEEYKDECKCKN